MAIVVIGTVFVDIKGFPLNNYIPGGRNAGEVNIVHGGVGRNVAEDIANVELRPKYVSMVDETALGESVIKKLNNHKVNTDYVVATPNGMGIWLAVFDETGDVTAAISKRPEITPMKNLIAEKGDEIFKDCDSIVIEVDIDKEIVKETLKYARKYNKKVFGLVANMSLAAERRDFIKELDCFICNEQEAEILFVEELGQSIEEMQSTLSRNVINANIKSMVVTLGDKGAVYADVGGSSGHVEALKVHVRDTTGAGDAFCAGVSIGLTYGKKLSEAVEIGTKLAASVITISENTCPRFLPTELGLEI